MPDVEGHYGHARPQLAGQFWIELKVAKLPRRATTPVRPKIRDAQVEWHKRRSRIGGNNWFLIQIGGGARAERILVHGRHVERLHAGLSLAKLRRLGVAVRKPQAVFDAIFGNS